MLRPQHYLLILFSLGFCLSSKATHNRAGEITYKWLYGFTYEIKVTTYTNIGSNGLADRCQDTVYFGDGTSATVNRSNGPSSVCGPAGDGVPISSTIKLNEYITTHKYSGPGNYTISMEDPNRNAGVINLPNSVNQVFYIESLLMIPAFGSGNNSSPVLTFPPIDIGCVNQCFYHNPGAYDIDGDSLSYEMTYCRGHLGVVCPGYTYPVTGGGTFHIDSLTGTLTWCAPQLQGEYNMAMLIKEWRLDATNTYVLIGYVLRDMQVDIGSCSNVPPHIAINNPDTSIIAGANFSGTVSATDANADVITLTANGGPFHVITNPAAFNTTSAVSTTSGVFSWTTDYTHIRRMPYQVTVKVQDNRSPINLVHFNTFNVKVLPDAPYNLTTLATNNYIALRWHKPTTYALSGGNALLRYRVYRKTGFSNWVHSNNETVPPAYTGFAFIGITLSNINDTVFYDANNGNPFPAGQDYSYVVLAEYMDGATSYVSNIASNQIYVGVKEMSQNNSVVSMFPNPVNEVVTLVFNSAAKEINAIELYDLTGRKLRTFSDKDMLTKETTLQLKLENITSGVYFIKIISGDQTIIKKIIKQ